MSDSTLQKQDMLDLGHSVAAKSQLRTPKSDTTMKAQGDRDPSMLPLFVTLRKLKAV